MHACYFCFCCLFFFVGGGGGEGGGGGGMLLLFDPHLCQSICIYFQMWNEHTKLNETKSNKQTKQTHKFNAVYTSKITRIFTKNNNNNNNKTQNETKQNKQTRKKSS